jgi:DNA-binding transcriptional ArsR family regulator
MSIRKKPKLSSVQFQSIARLFAALAEPSRLSLLFVLQSGARTVTELMAACDLKQANVSKHLAVLHDHHLVKRTRQGTSISYEIADPMIFPLCNLVCGKIEKDARRLATVFKPGL